MINVNFVEFSKQAIAFESIKNSKVTNAYVTKLSRSKGSAINKMNDCLIELKDYCANVDDLFAATSDYVRKAAGNIYSCEESTSGN